MPDSVRFGVDTASIRGARDDAARRMLRAGSDAVRVTTRELEQDLEQLVRSAVPGGLWRAIKSAVYPRTGMARNPAGEIYINGGSRTQGAFDFFARHSRPGGWISGAQSQPDARGMGAAHRHSAPLRLSAGSGFAVGGGRRDTERTDGDVSAYHAEADAG